MQRLVGELTDLNIKFKLEQAAGAVCKIIYPIPVTSFIGKGTEVAVWYTFKYGPLEKDFW